MRFFLPLLITVLCLQEVFAENYALVIGGSGEDSELENFFLRDFERLNQGLSRRGFKVVNVFDAAKTQGKFVAQSASTENIEAAVQNLFGRAKKGDKVLVLFHAHGGKRSKGAANSAALAHPIQAEDGRYEVGSLLGPIKKTEASVLLMDLSCYSGRTQDLIAQKEHGSDSAVSARTAFEKLCIVTAASPHYVSICSGDPASNSFTAALLGELEGRSPLTAEQLFSTARVRDNSATNLPQISSFPNAMNSPWDEWLLNTDPSGIEGRHTPTGEDKCEKCLEAEKNLTDTMTKLATRIDLASAKQLLGEYRERVSRQITLQRQLESSIERAKAELVTQKRFAAFKAWDYRKLLYFARLPHHPSLQVERKRGKLRLTEQGREFLNSIQDLSREQKREIVEGVTQEGAVGQFTTELHKRIGDLPSQLRTNRDEINELATQLLAYERRKYAEAFRTEKGNACQKFSF